MVLSFIFGFCKVSFILLTLMLAVIDIISLRLPDKLTFPLMGLGLFHSILMGAQPLIQNGIATLIIGGLFVAVALIYPSGMGMGDAKYVAGLALFLGLPSIIFALALATLLALILGGFLIIFKRITPKQQVPFGPFLTLGAWMTIFWY